MPETASLLDATNTVPIGDARAVAAACERILETCFGAGSVDRDLLVGSFVLVGDLFAGRHPGYLACDMPYHDLRHSLDVALVMARLVAGYQRERGPRDQTLTPEQGMLGVLLGLLHDSGYIRRTLEAALSGPQLSDAHESRSVAFAASYLRTTPLAGCATLAPLILATRLKTDLDHLFAGFEAPAVALGRMLASADLLSQMSDRCYLERCYYHLYPELVLGGCDRVRAPDGREQLLYADAFDLLRKTPNFYESVVRKRLNQDLRQMSRHLATCFAGDDPYGKSIQRNLDRLARVDIDERSRFLGPEPMTTTRDLAAIYHGPSQPRDRSGGPA